MKYAIIKVVNGNYSVHAEGYTDVSKAKTAFHGVCQTLWNEPTVYTGEVMIVNEQLDPVEGYKENIHHDPAPVEEPAEE